MLCPRRCLLKQILFSCTTLIFIGTLYSFMPDTIVRRSPKSSNQLHRATLHHNTGTGTSTLQLAKPLPQQDILLTVQAGHAPSKPSKIVPGGTPAPILLTVPPSRMVQNPRDSPSRGNGVPPKVSKPIKVDDSVVHVIAVHDLNEKHFILYVRGIRQLTTRYVNIPFCVIGKLTVPVIENNVDTFLCPKPKDGVMANTERLTLRHESGQDLKTFVRWGSRQNVLAGVRPVALCLVTMMKNEENTLDDWIRYHTRQGVGRFIIYDNNSTDGTVAILAKYKHVTRVFWPWRKTQYGGWSHGLVQSRGKCNRTLFIDVDEYVFPRKKGMTVKDMLFDTTGWYTTKAGKSDADSICMQLKLMGSSGLVKRPKTTLAEAYIHFDSWYPSLRGKCAVRPESCDHTTSVHLFPVDQSMSTVSRFQMHVVHYKFQCWECYVENKYRKERPSPRTENRNISKIDVEQPLDKWTLENQGPIDTAFRDYKRMVDKWPYNMDVLN